MPTATPLRIQVHYPAGDDTITLRRAPDWEREIEPRRVSADRSRFEFELPGATPFTYFKPVLRRDGQLHWARGENCLALDGAGDQVCYPYFFARPECSPCQLRTVETGQGGSHRYRIFYPPGYHENPLRRYPVLYMQDGQNLFFPGEAFGGEHWRVAETLDLLGAMNAIEPVIVVGVYPDAREREYTRPGYEDYGSLLVGTLKPAVDAAYRTLPGPETTAVMGSSLGGVVSFYLAWQYPEVFGMAACLSSTFGWRDDLAERVASEPRRPVRFYLDSGWPRDNFEVTRHLRGLLLDRDYREGVDLLYLAFPQAMHNEQAWAMRSHIPYQFFFGRRARLPGHARAA